MQVHRRIAPHGCGSGRYAMNLSVCWGQKVLRGGIYRKSLKTLNKRIRKNGRMIIARWAAKHHDS